MDEYGVSFKSLRYLQDYDNFHYCSKCVKVFFFTNDEKSWVRINYAVIPQCVKILFFGRAVSPVSQNLYGQSLKDFNIFLARIYV